MSDTSRIIRHDGFVTFPFSVKGGEQLDATMLTCYMYITCHVREKRREKKCLFKVEQNGKYNTSEFAITSTSHVSRL